jgi:hypothetical protein
MVIPHTHTHTHTHKYPDDKWYEVPNKWIHSNVHEILLCLNPKQQSFIQSLNSWAKYAASKSQLHPTQIYVFFPKGITQNDNVSFKTWKPRIINMQICPVDIAKKTIEAKQKEMQL